MRMKRRGSAGRRRRVPRSRRGMSRNAARQLRRPGRIGFRL